MLPGLLNCTCGTANKGKQNNDGAIIRPGKPRKVQNRISGELNTLIALVLMYLL